ncbi:MAG: hypothetical protein EAZ92_14210 [Candidatus Kapaibacterium sp.]|nr:MAG: hypothetical protein EAZ92_14210 [Candidatus Kapabacteria bacterium]
MLSISALLRAQDTSKDNEIYLADVSKSNGTVSIALPVNISRHTGYDNQPWFTTDNRALLFSSIRGENNPTKQHDIYKYVINDSTTSQLTNTPESEFSPMIIPDDGQSISVVRVEKDSTQRIWRFDAKGMNPRLVLPSIPRVGYYAWIGAAHLALYIISPQRNQAPSVQLAQVQDSLIRVDTIDTQCGRCFRRIPSSIALSQAAFSYIHRTNDSLWTLKRVNLKNRIVSQIFSLPAGTEDYTWMQNGTVLWGKGRTIYARHARKDSAWREIADFSRVLPEGSIKRIVLSPDEKRIAFVWQQE